MTPYILIIAGVIALLTIIALLIRQNALAKTPPAIRQPQSLASLVTRIPEKQHGAQQGEPE